MAKCPNRNTAEYKALYEEFGSNIVTDNLINAYQDLNNTDTIPSIQQAMDFVDDNQTALSVRKREFAESVISNLISKKLVTKKYKGYNYVNATDGLSFVADKNILDKNIKKIRRYLEINNIPQDTVQILKTTRSAKIIVRDNLFSIQDILPQTRGDLKTTDIIVHLERMFPQIDVEVMSVSAAKEYYNSLPAGQKSKVKFDDIKSFYVNGKAVLIDGRVDANTAVEEVLHPFVDAIKAENPELFDSLLAETKENFPVLAQQIEASYKDKLGFNETHRNLELVTQALVRHFRQEYENTPTKSYLDKIADIIKWFFNIISDLHKYVTDAGLPVLKASQIKPSTTMSDIARMLNTSDITFEIQKVADRKVRYALSDSKQKIVNHVKAQANTAQKAIIDRLFNIAMKQSDTIDSLSAGPQDTKTGDSIVVLNEENHTYYDITDLNDQYTSATTAINGKMFNEQEVALNIAVGNDFDSIVDGILSDKTLDQVFQDLQADSKSVLKDDKALVEKAFTDLSAFITGLKADGTVFIPQVVVYDKKTKIAGTADIVGITPRGEIKIIDLKTSKTAYASTAKEQYKREWALQDDSLLKDKGVEKLSTRGKHGAQVNMYRRMFENMGYTVDQSDYGAQTFHIHVDITGKGTNQKFNGSYRMDGMVTHKPSYNNHIVDKLIPLNVDTLAKEKIDQDVSKGEMFNPVDDLNFLEDNVDYPTSPQFDDNRYESLKTVLKNHHTDLKKRREAIENYKKQLFVDKTNDVALTYTNNAIAAIELALDPLEGDAQLMGSVYANLLRDSIKEINSFIDYIKDPANFNKKEFITYALNFDKFASTFLGLKSIKDSGILNKTEASLLLTLEQKLREVQGDNYETGLIKEAVIDYVREYVRENSNKDFTEEELNKMLVEEQDVTWWDLETRDLATSPDTLSALIAKEFSRARLRGQERAEALNAEIRSLGNRLAKLTGTQDPRKIYEFMAEMDEDGRFTGLTIRKLGQQYYLQADKLRDALKYDNGDPIEYVMIDDLETADPDDIKHNLDLYQKKQAYADFWRAETIEDGKLVDGEHHEYTQEWKDIRARYQTFVPSGAHGYWIFKPGVSPEEQAEFRLKYMDQKEDALFMEKKNGEPTGRLIPGTSYYPKRKYRVAKEITRSGKVMTSEKYNKIMNPTDALGRAQRDFYIAYTERYDAMLKKLPMAVRDQMLGRAPLVRGKMISHAKNQAGTKLGFEAWLRNKKDWLKQGFSTTSKFRRVAVDSSGNFVDSLPILFVGRPADEKKLKAAEEKVAAIKLQYKQGKIKKYQYDEQISVAKAEVQTLLGKPGADEISMDFADSLIKFTAMAENYEQMDDISDTLKAIKTIVEDRTYYDADTKTGTLRRAVSKGADAIGNAALKMVGKKGTETQEESNTVKRVKAWFKMVYYNSDEINRTVIDKAVQQLISYSSLSYVAFNAIGNLNNLAIASVNNTIEALGGRFYTRSSYLRANKEFYLGQIGQSMIKRTAYAASRGAGQRYDPRLPMTKWEALAMQFKMMDADADIRENIQGNDALNTNFFSIENLKAFGYSLQDAAEYKVQTTVGMALLMDTIIENSSTGDRLNLWDAYEFDSKTQTAKLKEGYDTIVETKGIENPKEIKKEFTENFRFDTRMKIREVNKQIHGNYAREDRMVIQRRNLGQLLAQFHKWVAPAIRARFQREYFDENLGWMEGRYKSWYEMMAYSVKQLAKLNLNVATFKEGFMKERGYGQVSEQVDQKIENKIFGFQRTWGDISMLFATLILKNILMGLFDDDDDDNPTLRRLKNLAIYQTDRTYSELVMFMPVLPDGLVQMGEMIKDPIASTRTLGAIGEALQSTTKFTMANTGAFFTRATDNEARFTISPMERYNMMNNSELYYQNRPKKGMLKMRKEWFDAIPALYTIQKWEGFLKRQDFYID